MTIQDVQDIVIAPMLAIYELKATDESQQLVALREYQDTLKHLSAEDLRAGWKTIRATYKSRVAPTPAAILAQCQNAATQRTRETMPSRADKEAEERAFRAMEWEKAKRTPLALQAVREGWAWSMKLKVLEGQPVVTSDLRNAHRQAEATFQALERREIKFGSNLLTSVKSRETLMNMYHTLQVRETETAYEIRNAQGFSDEEAMGEF